MQTTEVWGAEWGCCASHAGGRSVPGRGAGRHGGAKAGVEPQGQEGAGGQFGYSKGRCTGARSGRNISPWPPLVHFCWDHFSSDQPELRWRLRWRPKAPAAEDRKGPPHGQSEISLLDGSPGTRLLGTLVIPRQAACAQPSLKAHAYGLPGSERAQQGRAQSLRAPDSWVALSREPEYPGVAPAIPTTGQ